MFDVWGSKTIKGVLEVETKHLCQKRKKSKSNTEKGLKHINKRIKAYK